MKVLDEQIETMIDRGENITRHGQIYICKVCGKEDTKSHIKEHIEANHLEGISVPVVSVRRLSGSDIY